MIHARCCLPAAVAAAVSMMGAAVAHGSSPSGWYRYSPTGAESGDISTEILSRCTPQQRATAYDSDRVTYCHEAAHQLHSRIRNSRGGTGNVNAFYVGGGVCIVLREPKVTLDTVARYVSAADRRHHLFGTYFVQSRQWWNDEPLYVMDEWTAYCAGTQAAIELGIDAHGSDRFMLVFSRYAAAVLVAVEKHDPNYADLALLRQFVAWQTNRANKLATKYRGRTQCFA